MDTIEQKEKEKEKDGTSEERISIDCLKSFEEYHISVTDSIIKEIRFLAEVKGCPRKYEGYSWIKVKSFKIDNAKDDTENLFLLKDHHEKEVSFLLSKKNELIGNNIVLVGFMGVGKTSVGKELSKSIGFDFIDLDEVIELDSKMKISEIFNFFGESIFRFIEKETLIKISNIQKTVISVGGGTILDPDSRMIISALGKVFILDASPEIILNRVMKNPNSRPLISENMSLEKISKIKIERERFYNKTGGINILTDYKTIGDVSCEIKKLI